ncbi:MAG: 2,3-diphosphoglycerate-dependent phosphoglycerate mutase [Candidatus Binatia bacterium]
MNAAVRHEPAVNGHARAHARLMLLRHGESQWNSEGRFTGWTDVPLTSRGRDESRRAGEVIAASGIRFGACYSSCLQRASDTAGLVLLAMGQRELPIHTTWRLNERHYGALQGLLWWQGVLRFGPSVVVRCKKSHDVPPPMLRAGDPRHPANDPRYADVPRGLLPAGESLGDARIRLTPAWESEIAPSLSRGIDTLVVAHKNTIRALTRLLSQISVMDVGREVINTCEPIVFEFDESMRIVGHGNGNRR